jgi:DNA-binding CsgD family transcriptional regulator
MSAAEQLETRFTPLSPNQMRVLELLGEGKLIREMGPILFMSESTVKSHVYHMYQRLRVTNTHGAVARGYQLGLLRMPGSLKEERYWLLDAKGDRITYAHSRGEAERSAEVNIERVRRITVETRYVTPWEPVESGDPRTS